MCQSGEFKTRRKAGFLFINIYKSWVYNIMLISVMKNSSLIKKLLLVTLLLSASHALLAKDALGRHNTMGLGNNTCNAFVHEYDSHASYYLSWLAGYMTAYNVTEADTYSIFGNNKDISQIQTWLLDYCKFNSEQTFEHAVVNLIRNLKYFRQRTKNWQFWYRAYSKIVIVIIQLSESHNYGKPRS